MSEKSLVVKKKSKEISTEIVYEKAKKKPKTVILDYTPFQDESNVVRLEMNVIEFPLFSKNKRLDINTTVKYIFNKEKNSFLEITPANNNKIPGEFEERVFLALMRLYRLNGYSQTIYTDFYTLISEMNVKYSGRTVQQTKTALERLAKTFYKFNNCFYMSNIRGLTDEMLTNIFSMRTISFTEAVSMEGETQKYFRNSKIKEIIEIKLSSHFYENITSKGFLRFDSKVLLELEDTVARDLYKMMTKWRNKKLFINLTSQYIASKLPLAFNKANNIPKTIRRLQEAFAYLKEKNLIKDYLFKKDSTNEKSSFEVTFNKEHNFDFYQDSEITTLQNALLIEKVTEEENIIIELPEIIEKSFEKAIRSIYISLHVRELETILPEILNQHGEKITVELLNRLYNYNKKIESLKPFVNTLIKNIKLDEKEGLLDKLEQKSIFSLSQVEEAVIVNDVLKEEIDESKLTETEKKFLERARKIAKN